MEMMLANLPIRASKSVSEFGKMELFLIDVFDGIQFQVQNVNDITCDP